MPIDNVQLKREDVVGSEVVLEDINPKTSSNSVTSTATGDSLDVVLDRIWNAINARLSRVVNSVNGRTGVVVLDASDIGLGRVDNVSFGDIKKWVINMMRSEFKDKNMKLVNDLTELNALISTNNKSYAGSPFFSTAGYAGDKRSYIGYIYYDEGTKKLEYKSLPINTVGFTDNSLIYNENVNGVDTRGGGLAVNIHKDEDALYLKNPDAVDKSESGLMIDKSRITPQVFMCSGLYYDNELEPDGLLYYDGSGPNDSKTVAIRIDNSIVLNRKNEPCIMKLKSYVKHGDLVMCSFKNDYIVDDVVKAGVNEQLQRRQPCVGYIEAAHWDLSDYIIRLITVDPYVGPYLVYNTDNTLDLKLDHYGGLDNSDHGPFGNLKNGLGIRMGLGLRFHRYDWKGLVSEGSQDRNLTVSLLDRFTGYGRILFSDQDNRTYSVFLGGLRYVRNSGHSASDIAIRINNKDDWNMGYEGDGIESGASTQWNIDLHNGTKGLCIDDDNVLGVQLDDSRGDLKIDPSSGCLTISDDYKPSLKSLMLTSSSYGDFQYAGLKTMTIRVDNGLTVVDYPTGDPELQGAKLGINLASNSCLKIDDNGFLDIDYAKLAEKLKEYNTDSETPEPDSGSTETPDDTGGEDGGTTTDPDNPDNGTTTPETPDDTGDDSGNTDDDGDDTNTGSGTDTGSGDEPTDTGEGTETTTPEETTNSGET